MTYAETVPQLVPIEFKSGPSYVKHTIIKTQITQSDIALNTDKKW